MQMLFCIAFRLMLDFGRVHAIIFTTFFFCVYAYSVHLLLLCFVSSEQTTKKDDSEPTPNTSTRLDIFSV